MASAELSRRVERVVRPLAQRRGFESICRSTKPRSPRTEDRRFGRVEEGAVVPLLSRGS
jgi:hypothetical protein